MRNERAWPQQCWKSSANGSNIFALRFGDQGTKEMLGVVGWKVWPVSNFAQQHATTSNNIQQGVQTDATCSIQQCWELLVNSVASVCTQPYPPFSTWYVLLLLFCLAVVYASVCRPNLIRLVIPLPLFFFSSTQVAPASAPLLAN